jgi:thymidylate synthase (FAD)
MKTSGNVLDDGIGYVSLVNSMGGDYSIVNAARVSYHRDRPESREFGKGEEALIAKLIANEHGTPLEHTSLTFLVLAPMFVVRQWMRHRIGWSYNELSMRYIVNNEPQFYVPRMWFSRSPKKVAEGESSPATHFSSGQNAGLEATAQWAYGIAVKAYNDMIDNGVARGQARMVLPVALYTKFYATTNMRALVHFYRLRSAKAAQWEIRQYAEALRELSTESFPNVWVAYDEFFGD